MTIEHDRARAARVLPPELRLVYATAVTGPQPSALVAELAAAPLDWAAVAVLADRERAVPAVLAAVQAARPDLAKDPALETLRRLGMVATFESVRLETKLEQLLDALQPAGIVPVLLKGAGIALARRGTLRGRPMRDLDLLLAPEQVAPATTIARASGWCHSRHAAADEYYEVAAHRAPLEDASGSQLQLELHSDLFFSGHPFGVSAAEVRASAEAITWRGRSVRVPDARNAILHAALHASWAHALRGAWWRSWFDVSPLLPTDAHGWAALVQQAEAARAATSLYWVLRLGRAMTEIAVPTSVLRQLGRHVPGVAADALFSHLAGNACTLLTPSPSVRFNRLAWRLAVQPGASGHGSHTPWQHEALLGLEEPDELTVAKMGRHLRNWRSYVAYGQRLLSR